MIYPQTNKQQLVKEIEDVLRYNKLKPLLEGQQHIAGNSKN